MRVMEMGGEHDVVGRRRRGAREGMAARRDDPLALRLSGAREGRGLTQRAVAARLGVSGSFVAGLETARYRPSVAMLRQLAVVLGVPYMELLVLAGIADPPEVEDEAAADGRWFAGLSPEERRWLRQVAESRPAGRR